ncbi:hypothetical protein WA026_016547 [Henosepilachna vigintioctopunctata]|uniref:Uncharacterized protein n=1 Tax=Henosepilachna vigintioctopunctata TaxID=420089 RepID=A0AAW1VDE8_9CUCU
MAGKLGLVENDKKEITELSLSLAEALQKRPRRREWTKRLYGRMVVLPTPGIPPEERVRSNNERRILSDDSLFPSKRPKQAPSNKHSTSVNFNISNETSLSDPAKRYNPTPGPSPTLQPTKKGTYFEKLDVAVRMELDHGTSNVIDIQPDLRFPFQYSTYCITERYPELNVKSHPSTSTFILICYDQIILNTYLLICELHSRELSSYSTFKYESFSFHLDVGQILPPQLMIVCHNLLSSVRSNADPETILRQLYASLILDIDRTRYTSSQFLGGYFDIAQRPTTHRNWIN